MQKDNQTFQLNVCYIGLGANLDSPIKQINQAISTLANTSQIKLIKSSSLYKSPPMGPQDQNDYINAVIEIETHLPALALLDTLQTIELLQGRVRKNERWGARTLDLDLLLYGNQIIDNDRLTVPHYGISERAFVLYPLSEIAPNLEFPNLKLAKGQLATKRQPLATLIIEMEQTKPTIHKLGN